LIAISSNLGHYAYFFPFSPFPLFSFSPVIFSIRSGPLPPPLLPSFGGTGVSPVRTRHWWGRPPGPPLSGLTANFAMPREERYGEKSW
jgi:hypothetical protein